MKMKNGKWIFIIACIGIVLLCCVLNYKKELAIDALKVSENKKYVYPLGTIIGIQATTDGVLVIGYEEDDIQYIGGLQIGDNITKVEDEYVGNSRDITKIINKSKKRKVKVTFERNGKYKTEYIQTKKENEKYKLGLWVRDEISGIGTMTFYDPDEGVFRAIGHSIVDKDTQKLLKIKEGKLYIPNKIEISKSDNNEIGKIKADIGHGKYIGYFKNNRAFGISGNFNDNYKGELPLIEVGNPKDIKLGHAMILFEDKNRNITSYDIKIKSLKQDKTNYRNMIIEVVDKDLLEYTGGIVQGMSGAPIIQNNKIIGAITHVFSDNPKNGYGIFINEMIELEKRY